MLSGKTGTLSFSPKTPWRPNFESIKIMTITLNGLKKELPAPLALTELLEQAGLTGKPVVVEHNKIALLPKEIFQAQINDGDVIEIIQITAGG
jgi:sulfur carrier protein